MRQRLLHPLVVDTERVAVGGQSAGGNLAAGVCLTARDRGAPSPVLQVLAYPPLDLATDPAAKVARTARPIINPRIATVFNNAYVPDVASRTDPLASPLLAADLTGLPRGCRPRLHPGSNRSGR
jgi:acetyl esterase